MFVKNSAFMILALSILLSTVVCKNVKTISRGPKCQERLLDIFQLEGLDIQKAVDMTICPNVIAENNCCSVTDEIKIVKKWNNYSKPKLYYHMENVISSIKKMFDLHKFVEKLNDIYIRFHYENVKHVKTKETTCFEKSTLMNLNEFKELINEYSASEEWFDAYTKYIVQNIVDYLSKRKMIDSIVTPGETFDRLISDIYGNKKLWNLIKNADDNYVFEEDLTQITDIIERAFTHFGNNPVFKDIPMKRKADNVKKILNLRPYLKNLLLRDNIPKKNLKKIQENTYKGHINNIIDFILDNNIALFTNSVLKPESRTGMVAKVIEGLKNSEQLKVELVYFTHMKTLKENNAEDKIDHLKGTIGDIIYKALSKDVNLNKAASNNIYNDFITKFNQLFILKDQLYKTMSKNYKLFIYQDMLSRVFKQIEQINIKEKSELKKLFRSKVLTEKFEGSLDISTVPFYKASNDKAYKKQYMNNVKAFLKNILDDTSFKQPVDINYDELYHHAIKRFMRLLKNVIFIDDEKNKNQVCAVVTKTSLVKKIVFNKEKFRHCRKSLIDLMDVDIKEITGVIDEMKEEMKKMIELKKTAYCIVCDKNLSHFVKRKNKSVTFSHDFCGKLISRFSKYLEWKNVTLVNYQNKLFQYLQCYLTDGKAEKFPYKFFGGDQIKNRNKVKDCLSASGNHQTSACENVCTKFNLFNYSEVFDGEKETIDRMYNNILNTIRIFGFRFEDSSNESNQKNKAKIKEQKKGYVRYLESKSDEDIYLNNKKHLIDGNAKHFDNKKQYKSNIAFYDHNQMKKNDRIIFNQNNKNRFKKHIQPKGENKIKQTKRKLLILKKMSGNLGGVANTAAGGKIPGNPATAGALAGGKVPGNPAAVGALAGGKVPGNPAAAGALAGGKLPGNLGGAAGAAGALAGGKLPGNLSGAASGVLNNPNVAGKLKAGKAIMGAVQGNPTEALKLLKKEIRKILKKKIQPMILKKLKKIINKVLSKAIKKIIKGALKMISGVGAKIAVFKSIVEIVSKSVFKAIPKMGPKKVRSIVRKACKGLNTPKGEGPKSAKRNRRILIANLNVRKSFINKSIYE